MSISPGYLDVFRIPILRGRDFSENDTGAAPGVALITESLAKVYWPGQDPIGKHIDIGRDMGASLAGEPTREIVGIVRDFHNNGVDQPADPMVIVPIAQVTDAYTAAYNDSAPILWIMRTHNEPHQLIAPATQQLRIASAGFPLANPRTMEEAMGASTVRQSFNMILLTTFGGVALFLAAVGIYSLMAYSVQQRTQEMGIRMALGADRESIRKLVLRQGLVLAIVGVVAGLIAAFALTRVMASFLFGVRAWDPVAFLAAPSILLVVALLAVWLPATRASKLDPVQALHTE